MPRFDRKADPVGGRLSATCSECGKPYVVSLHVKPDRHMRLTPIRTASDLAYIDKLRRGETLEFEIGA